jgi:hypothetical protein
MRLGVGEPPHGVEWGVTGAEFECSVFVLQFQFQGE